MTYTLDCLKVVSYNCRGWKSGSNYVQSLLQSCDICLIQEHWLLRENLDSLIISDDFLSVGVSGMDSSILLSGRPFGGCGILYRKSLSSVVRRIFTDSKRLCAISITLNNSCDNSPFVILLICVYLPTDYSTAASHSAFSESLCELHGLILAEHFIIAGDFNVDFSRPGPNCSNLSTFMLSNNLISVDQMSNINFTYHNDVYSCCSSPDHILTLSNYAYLIDSVSVLDSVENFSDHLSLHFTLKFSNFLSLPSNRRSIIVVLLVTLTLLPTLQLTGLKSPHGMFHLTVTKFCPPYLNFLQISLIAVTQTALVTTLILTPTVCNFLTVLLLQLIYAFPSTINVSAIHLFLVGMLQPNTSNSLLTFGIKFGLNVVAPPLVF